MKKALCALAITLASYAHGQVAVSEAQAVNVKISAGSGTTITNAFGSPVTQGNAIVCLAFESAAAIPVITDALSNTYVVAVSSAIAPGYTVAVATNIKGGTTDTITETTTSGAASFSCHELSGAPPVGQAWDFVANLQGTMTSINLTQITALLPNELVIVGAALGAGTVNSTPSIAGVPSTLTIVDQSNTAPSGGAALSDVYSAHVSVTNQPSFTQIIPLSASETVSGLMIGIKPVAAPEYGLADPCSMTAKQFAGISQTSSLQIIGGSIGKQIYICSLDLVTATAQNIALVEGTGSTCGTSTTGIAGGSTAATGWNFAANSGLVKGDGLGSVFKTGVVADSVCLLLSGSGQVSGSVQYVWQ